MKYRVTFYCYAFNKGKVYYILVYKDAEGLKALLAQKFFMISNIECLLIKLF